MNATQFIKYHGLEKAREVVDGAPNYNYQRIYFAFTNGTKVEVNDLKRLVESVDLVNSLGGLQSARKEAHRDCFAFEKNKLLLRAINDYESIYGEGNEKNNS